MLTLTKKRKFSLRRIFGGKGAKQQKIFTEYEKERMEVLIAEIESLIPQKPVLTSQEVRQIIGFTGAGICHACKRRAFDYRDKNGRIVIGVYKHHYNAWLIKRQGLIEYLKRINS